jgi:hypothetical protein
MAACRKMQDRMVSELSVRHIAAPPISAEFKFEVQHGGYFG